MKKFDIPPPVKLVCGILYRDQAWLHRSLKDLETEFGEIDFRSESLLFDYTAYYFEEMGAPLYRSMVSFQKLVDGSGLAAIKLFANSLEERYTMESDGGLRAANIDPGYLTGAAFILASSKNYAHRIYLGKGVFAQQEVLFSKKKILTLDWTYPDYRSLEYHEILRKIREIYLEQLRARDHF